MADATTSEIPAQAILQRSNSISQNSETSQTAAEFISSQLQLEAEAREALPYQFDTCTKPIGALRQALFSCLTCNPPPKTKDEEYAPAGVCYSCSISCHGEHTLVELFAKRDFVCDCGTTRLPESSPCTLRRNEATGEKGNVTSEEPAKENKYNQNFRNVFCGCGEDYDPHQERGTMFQCMGLGTVEEGGCGEDWWHPECIVGINRNDWKAHVEQVTASRDDKAMNGNHTSAVATEVPVAPSLDLSTVQEEAVVQSDESSATFLQITESVQDGQDGDEDEDITPEGFPQEDDFEYLICYKCAGAFPWIKQYAGTPGFLPAAEYTENKPASSNLLQAATVSNGPEQQEPADTSIRKRKAEDDNEEESLVERPKRQKSEPLLSKPDDVAATANVGRSFDDGGCRRTKLFPATSKRISIFLKPDFRVNLCKCVSCFPLLKQHPQLLEEEDTYEPPVSEDGDGAGGGSVGTGSLLDRGEAAFSNMDRVRAIEGAMVYAQLKDKVKTFLQPFAESGQAVGAEDIKAYFEKLRGDNDAIKAAQGDASQWRKDEKRDKDDGSDTRKEQNGY